MPLKTIKDVDDRTWRELKAIAARNGTNMGKMLEVMIREYSRRNAEVWDKILNWKYPISGKEAERRKRVVEELRKEHGFRE